MVAKNGLLNRRTFLAGSAGMVTTAIWADSTTQEPWRSGSGRGMSAYGSPSKYVGLERLQIAGHPFALQAGSSSTPLEKLNGTITPNSLHFERHHSGVPEINPAVHRLGIFGNVKRPRSFGYEDLLRYPLVSKILFIECSGNSYRNLAPTALDQSAGELNGLFSCAEWTGVPLRLLLEEAGYDPKSDWVVAEGADAAGMNRSLPIDLALEDALVALYQNGEPLRGEQGFPLRLLVPGCEGNLSVKWLRSLQVRNGPAHTREETSKYTDLQKDGRANQFSLRMGVKSVITAPSGKMLLPAHGVYEISGLAWSGHGAVSVVEVSADGGRSWQRAEIQSEPGLYRPTRFRLPWRWLGQAAVLQSRAIDSVGNTQPTRTVAMADAAPGFTYHYNGIQSWGVDQQGRVSNVYG